MKWINLTLRLILGGIFLASAVIKIWNVQVSQAHGIQFSHVPDLATFAQDVTNYHVPPRSLTNLVAITFVMTGRFVISAFAMLLRILAFGLFPLRSVYTPVIVIVVPPGP